MRGTAGARAEDPPFVTAGRSAVSILLSLQVSPGILFYARVCIRAYAAQTTARLSPAADKRRVCAPPFAWECVSVASGIEFLDDSFIGREGPELGIEVTLSIMFTLAGDNDALHALGTAECLREDVLLTFPK